MSSLVSELSVTTLLSTDPVRKSPFPSDSLATSLLPTEPGRRSAATSPPAGFPPLAGWVSFAMSSVKTVFAPPKATAVPPLRTRNRAMWPQRWCGWDDGYGAWFLP